MGSDGFGTFLPVSKNLHSFVYFLLLLVNTTAVFSIDRIESCLMIREEQEVKTPNKRSAAMFHLHFGDPAVEVFNAINSSDVSRIKSLSNCVAAEDSFLYEISRLEANKSLIHQGNVTYISGIFQQLLPDVMSKVQDAAMHGIEGAEWITSVKSLGIRTVQYSEINTALKMKSRAQLAKEKKEKVHVFSIGEKPVKVDNGEVDLHSDEHVSQYMRSETDSVYTMIINLSSRAEFFGGNILIGKEETDNNHENSNYEENEDIFDTSDDELIAPGNLKQMKPEFHALHTKIQRYTPELGSALLIRSECPHGVHKVTRGVLNTLLIEFWPYADAPIGSKYQSANDAKPLIRKDEL